MDLLKKSLNLRISLNPATGDINPGRRLKKTGPLQERSTQLYTDVSGLVLFFTCVPLETHSCSEQTFINFKTQLWISVLMCALSNVGPHKFWHQIKGDSDKVHPEEAVYESVVSDVDGSRIGLSMTWWVFMCVFRQWLWVKSFSQTVHL